MLHSIGNPELCVLLVLLVLLVLPLVFTANESRKGEHEIEDDFFYDLENELWIILIAASWRKHLRETDLVKKVSVEASFFEYRTQRSPLLGWRCLNRK